VVVSRGELVEIGGGFRIPEMVERAGTRLVEVGSTNRTRIADYAAAVAGPSAEPDPERARALNEGPSGETIGAVLKVHRSNFRIEGFTEEASLDELAALTRAAGLPLVYDLGSGMLLRPALIGLPSEPRPQEALASGADLVVFSGDKLMGGPQAGVIVGRADRVASLRRNPLCRALRVDKTTLAGIEATLRLYRDPERAVARVPVLRMLAARPEDLRHRANELVERLVAAGVPAEVASTSGRVGGGTFPGAELPSWAAALRPGSPDALAAALRAGTPPVVARIVDGALLLDVRTLLPGQEELLLWRVAECWQAGEGARP